MNEEHKFIYRIVCEPKLDVKEENDIYSITQKITTARLKLIDEGIIGQLREIMREKGITELIAIDESKVLRMLKDLELFEIMRKMYMTNINGKYVFTFEHLSQEEKERLHREWCNTF